MYQPNPPHAHTRVCINSKDDNTRLLLQAWVLGYKAAHGQ